MSTYVQPALRLLPERVLVAGYSRDPEGHKSLAHRHPEGQLLGSLKGLLTVGTDLGVWVVPATHAVWLPPHQVHWAHSHGPLHGWSVYVREDACKQLPAAVRTVRTSGLLRETVARASTWPTHGVLGETHARIAGVIMDEICALPEEPFGLPLPRDPRIARVARAVLDEPADTRGIAHWAALAAISERTLSRRFVDETGFSFTNWRQRARLLRSLELLARGEAVTSIALDLGYTSPSSFIALFRREFGAPPAAWRARMNSVEPSTA